MAEYLKGCNTFSCFGTVIHCRVLTVRGNKCKLYTLLLTDFHRRYTQQSVGNLDNMWGGVVRST